MSENQELVNTKRRTCPMCANTNISELVDKSDVISYYPKVFGKKYHCLECKYEWK